MTMVKCGKCNEVFSEDELVHDYTDGGYLGESHWSCPFCGNDEFDYVEECSRCGLYVDPYEVFGSKGSELCLDCIHELTDVRTVIDYGADTKTDVKINGLFAFVFEGELDEILKAEFMKLPESMQKRFITDFVDRDKGDFADWNQGGRADE